MKNLDEKLGWKLEMLSSHYTAKKKKKKNCKYILQIITKNQQVTHIKCKILT